MAEAQTIKKETKIKNPLKNERVFIKPVIWSNKLIHKEHSGNWQYDNTVYTATVQIDGTSGIMKEPLTKEEKAFFEDPSRSGEHGLSFKSGDLSVRKKDDNFWENYVVKVRKQSDGKVKEDQTLETLELSKAEDYFKYKVLLTNAGPKGTVANGWENRYSRGSNKVVLVSEGERYADNLKKTDKLKKANNFFYNIDHSTDKMYDFLNVFYLENKDYNKPPAHAGADRYRSDIQTLIDDRVDDVLKIISDKDDYEMKILVHRAIKEGILRFNGNTGIDDVATGKPLGNNLSQVIRFLKDDKNQNFLLKIKAQIEKDE